MRFSAHLRAALRMTLLAPLLVVSVDGALGVARGQQARAAGPKTASAGHALPLAVQRQIALQVALDRAGFSPGEIDGRNGPNTRNALKAAGLAAQPEPYERAVTTYVITPEDVAGPFIDEVPGDLMEQARLPALAYVSPLELLSERFHVHPTLLLQMNAGVPLDQGRPIAVPNVEPFHVPSESGRHRTPSARAAEQAGAPVPGAVRVSVTKATSSLVVENERGEILFHAPVTVGSEHDPLPVGHWKITGVYMNPAFYYNPELFWNADPAHAKARIPAGPNNPVGPIWIDITKEHYGFHGTPEPSRVGHTESHGCIRLTNWDVTRLAKLVADGMEVVFQ